MTENRYLFSIAKSCLLTLLLFFIPADTFSFPYKGLDLKISGSVTEIYDDNVDFDDENEKKDFITKTMVFMEASAEGKVRNMSISGYVENSNYARNSNSNNTSGGLTVNFQNEFSKHDRVSLSNNYTRSFEPSSFEDAFSRTIDRAESSQNIFGLQYSRDISEKLFITTGYTNYFRRVSGDNSQESYKNNIAFTTNYIYSAATTVSLSYNYEKTESRGSEINFPYHSIAARIRQHISKQLFIDVTGGADYIKRTRRDKEVTGIGGHLKLELNNSMKNSHVKITLGKRKSPDVNREELFDSWKTSILFTSSLSKKLSYNLEGFWGQGTFESTNVTQKFWGGSMDMIYEFNELLNGRLIYQHSNRKSSDISVLNEYTQNMIHSGLTIRF